MRPCQQDHGVDVVSVHVRKDAGCGLGQRVRGSLFIVLCFDPAHHPKTSNVVKLNGLEPEEAQVGEADPIAAILVASEAISATASTLLFSTILAIPVTALPRR